MKTAFLALLSLCSVSFTMAIPSITLNCRAYPDVCDHHYFANNCANFAFVLPENGFHRDADADDSLLSKRRRAVGCGGNTNCGANSDCDEIPYASTYDGGLGCYGVSAGFQGPQSDLYSKGSHHCVNRSQNRRHGNALKQFYANANIRDSKKFYLTVEVAPSNYNSGTFSYRQAVLTQRYGTTKDKAAKAKILAKYQANCNAYSRTGQQAILDRSSRDGVCPDKNTARWATSPKTTSTEIEGRAPGSSLSEDGNAAAIAAASANNFGLDRPRQVLTLSSGTKVFGLFGAPEFKLGHNVTLHSDEPVDEQGTFHFWNETVVGIQYD